MEMCAGWVCTQTRSVLLISGPNPKYLRVTTGFKNQAVVRSSVAPSSTISIPVRMTLRRNARPGGGESSGLVWLWTPKTPKGSPTLSPSLSTFINQQHDQKIEPSESWTVVLSFYAHCRPLLEGLQTPVPIGSAHKGGICDRQNDQAQRLLYFCRLDCPSCRTIKSHQRWFVSTWLLHRRGCLRAVWAHKHIF